MFEKPVVVYICPSFNAIEREIIRHNLCTKMPMAVITDTIKNATLIIYKAPAPEKFFIKNIELPDISVIVPNATKNKKNKNIQNRAVQQFNKVKQFQKRVVFNRTKHK